MPTEMNFVEQLISNGFVRYVSDVEKKKGRYDMNFNPKNGWMGVVVYHPYERFENGNKQVELSLERFNVKDQIHYSDGRKEDILVNEKLIRIRIGEEVVYENKFGVMPPKEIQEKLYAN